MKNCPQRRFIFRNGGVLLFLAVLALTGRPEARAEEAWKLALNQQLLAQKGCDVNYLTRVREFELAGEMAIEARAHCVDGRAFDAVRRKKHLKFEIHLCQPTLC